jgi:hypothetical protein
MTLTVFPSVVAFCWDSALSCSFSRSFSLRIFSIACRCRLMMFCPSTTRRHIAGKDHRQTQDACASPGHVRAAAMRPTLPHAEDCARRWGGARLQPLRARDPGPPSRGAGPESAGGPGTLRCTSGGPSPSSCSCGAGLPAPADDHWSRPLSPRCSRPHSGRRWLSRAPPSAQRHRARDEGLLPGPVSRARRLQQLAGVVGNGHQAVVSLQTVFEGHLKKKCSLTTGRGP